MAVGADLHRHSDEFVEIFERTHAADESRLPFLAGKAARGLALPLFFSGVHVDEDTGEFVVREVVHRLQFQGRGWWRRIFNGA